MQDRYLADLGFTDGEERVYISLLRIGASTTGPIAKEADVSRSKLYEILEKLSRKGVVSHFKKNNISYFKAAPPARIVDYLKEKEINLKDQIAGFEKKIPLFQGIIEKKKTSMEAEVFEGMDGIKNVRELALQNMKEGDEVYYFGNPTSGHEHVLGYWDEWNERRIKKKIKAFIIYNQDAEIFGKRRERQPYTKVRYLPNIGHTPAWIEIYGDTVAIAMKYKTPMSIVINNRYVAESFLTYFKAIWDASIISIPKTY